MNEIKRRSCLVLKCSETVNNRLHRKQVHRSNIDWFWLQQLKDIYTHEEKNSNSEMVQKLEDSIETSDSDLKTSVDSVSVDTDKNNR